MAFCSTSITMTTGCARFGFDIPRGRHTLKASPARHLRLSPGIPACGKMEPKMKFPDLVRSIADSLERIDLQKPIHKTFRPGIGPFGEPQLVRMLAQELTAAGVCAQTRRTPDLEVDREWAIEFKIVRPFGDNGREAENWSVNMLHPYPGNVSLIGDAIKLSVLNSYPCKGLLVIGYEHNPARISLDPLIASFELIATQGLKLGLGQRVEETRVGLCHPEHQVLRCIGWELEQPCQ